MLNSLKIYHSGVANCRNLPFGGRVSEIKGVSSNKGKRAGVATNVYSMKTLEKSKIGSANFKDKGSGVVYMWGRY